MKRPLAKLLAGLLLAPLCGAVDDARLWLPGNYQQLFTDLVVAAQLAESLEQCTRVLSGTLDLDQSTSEKPIFRILCRKKNGKTYNEMVDGASRRTLTTLQGDEAVLDLQALVQLRKREGHSRKVQAINQQIAELWPVCEKAFARRTAQMIRVETLYKEPLDPVEYRQQQSTFQFHFNAENPSGDALKYEAICRVRSVEDFDLRIRSRRTADQDRPQP